MAYVVRGYVYNDRKEYDKALTDYNKARELYSGEGNSFEVLRVEGMIQEINGLLSEPIAANIKIKKLMDSFQMLAVITIA